MDTVAIIRQLTHELPLNDFGLPTGIYRTDLLPYHLHISEKPAELLESKSSHLTPYVGAPEDQDAVSPDTVTLDPPDESESSASPPSQDDTQGQNVTDENVEEETVYQADPFALMSGEGDGLPDPIITYNKPEPKQPPVPGARSGGDGEYRIAGFPSKDLQVAYVPLQYDEGYPAFENGVAFWNRLDYEPTDAYMVFQRYILMNAGRPADRDDEEDEGLAATGTRSIGDLVAQLLPSSEDQQILELTDRFQEYYHLYYWGLRTRSYDLFRVTQHKQQQELRAIETQDDHYVMSRSIRQRLMKYIDSEEDFWDLMTPKVGVDMLKQVTMLERISAGVPAAGPSMKGDETKPGQSFEVAFRTIAQGQHGESITAGTVMDEDGQILDKALEDPDVTRTLQELIIKSTGG